MNGKLLTISIAAYNVEKYLHKLMDSIIAADRLEDMEVLVVNDGSRDSTLKIAQEYQVKYPDSIIVVDKENGGHGSTINKGIELATGKYFKAIDGDDWFDSCGLARLIDDIKQIEADLILTNFKNVYEISGSEKVRMMGCTADTKLEFNRVCKELTGICYHSIVIKTDILQKHQIKLTEHSFYVDNELICYIIPYINTVIYLNQTVYCYRLGREGQSVSVEGMQKNETQHLNVCCRLMRYYNDMEPVLADEKRYFMAKFISSVVTFQLDIQFSFRPSIQRLGKILSFDNTVKQYPLIYKIMANKTYRLWRKARCLLYVPARLWVNGKMNRR